MIRSCAAALGVALFALSGAHAEGPTQAPARAQSAADRLPKTEGAYRPLLRMAPGGVKVSVPVLLGMTLRGTQDLPADFQGNHFSADASYDTQLRAGVVIDSAQSLGLVRVLLEAEADLYTGVFSGGDTGALDMIGGPERAETFTDLRKAYGRVSIGPFLTLGAGYMTSHWGLGLLANDGSHAWAPGSAAFVDPRRGDRVLRGLVATGPWTNARLLFTLAADRVQGDDVMTEPDDEAYQFIASVIAGYGGPSQIGAYAVHRVQEMAFDKKTEITAVDLYARHGWRLENGVQMKAELETALITGTTTLAPTAEYPEADVLQFALAARVQADAGRVGGVVDFLWVTGDQNFDDGRQNGFKLDPNFEQGLVLHRQLMAAHTARGAVLAGDPELLGYPSEDLERFPSRGSVTNTVSVFPRLWFRPLGGLEVYFGPLLAFSEVPVADPRQTRLKGGTARNAFGGVPGAYLGTELDVGLRYRLMFGKTRLTLGAEGGVFQPGNAFVNAEGGYADLISGGRLLVRYEL